MIDPVLFGCVPTYSSPFVLYSCFQGKGELLEQPENFEDDHDNHNHSNYVKDISAHVGNSYQCECAVASIIQTERLSESFLLTWIRMQCEWAMRSFTATHTCC